MSGVLFHNEQSSTHMKYHIECVTGLQLGPDILRVRARFVNYHHALHLPLLIIGVVASCNAVSGRMGGFNAFSGFLTNNSIE